MGKAGNVPTDVQDGIRDALGNEIKIAYARIINLESKPDKFDARVLALSDYRVFILTPKIPMKLETSLHFLDINLLESRTPKKMVIGMESKRLVMLSNSLDENTDDFDSAVGHIIASLAKVFPDVSTEKLIAKIDFTPSTRLQDVVKTVDDVGQKDIGPCGNFSAMYRCMCDYHNLKAQEDVAWDVDMIYLSQDSTEMNLKDFDHLDGRHLLPIVSALEHNTWFRKLNASNVKLSPEVINEILRIMKTSTTVKELVLANVGIRADFCQRLCTSLVANSGSSLSSLDLSGNIIDDRGLSYLYASFTKLSHGLVELNLSRTGITAKGVNKLAEALLGNKYIPPNLRIIDLSENSFKGEDVSNLFNFLAQPNAVTDLRLASTECCLESLFAALQRGCAQNLGNLDVSGSLVSYKKQGKDVSVPPSWKQFFASAISLKNINFSGCRLPPDALRSVLEGIGSNPSLSDVELNLSSNGFGLPGNQGAQILEMCLCNVRNIRHLDLSDNGFDISLASILVKLSQNKSLRKLSIGRNLNNIKPKNVPQVIEAIIKLIDQENSPIRCLNVDNLRLKSETVLLINALGTNDTLTEIDISGNQMGDTGARMLSKALQLNKKLVAVYWDHNGTSLTGFQDIASALEKNFSLQKMPMPVNDAAQALRVNQEKTEQALQKIESVLQRNHGHRKMKTDQAYRLNQCFMISTLQQTVDVHLVQLQGDIEKVENLYQKYQLSNSSTLEEIYRAQALVKEANFTKKLLLQLQRIVQDSESNKSLQNNLNTLGTSLYDVVAKQLKANVSAMITCAEKQFPITLKNDKLMKELTLSTEAKSLLPAEFIRNLILDQLSADIANKTSELNLSAASHISDRILDDVMNEVKKSAQALKSILSSTRSQLLVSGQLKDEDAESKEHREGLKRQKTSSVTTDEEQDTAAEMPSLSSKNSQFSRRLRPKSAIDSADVKTALELCKGKTDLSASSDVELRVDSGHERSSSEERVLDSDDGKSNSSVPVPLPRKRRGQTNGKTLSVGVGSACEKASTDADKGGLLHKSLGDDGGGEILQADTKRSSQILEHETTDVGTEPFPASREQQQKSEFSAVSSKHEPLTIADQHRSDMSHLSTEGVVGEIMSTGDLQHKGVAEAPGFVVGSLDVPYEHEKSDRPFSDRPFVQTSESPLEEQTEVLNLGETAKVLGRLALKEKAETSLDQKDGKSLEGTGTKSSLHISGMDFFPADDISVPKLEHLVKDRPKRPKTRAMTRPVTFDPVIDESDVSHGVSKFFNDRHHLQTERKENGELAHFEEPEEGVKSETSKKTERTKAAVLSPETESKGLASSLMSRLKKKSPEGESPPLAQNDSAPSTSNSGSQKNEKSLRRGDNLKSCEELSRKASGAEELLENRPKQPAGMVKIGLPGMSGGASLVELRNKKAAAKHVSSLTESGKSSAAAAAKEKVQSSDRKSSQSKEPMDLPSSEDNVSGVSSRPLASTKARPPPPLAPKPSKRASAGVSMLSSTATESAALTQKSAVPITRGLSEVQELKELEQKANVHQSADTAASESRKRMSVREKAAHIDKSGSLKSVDGSTVSKKSATQQADGSAKLPESLSRHPSSDSNVSMASSLSALGPKSESPVLPSDPPSDADNDGDVKSKSTAKRQPDVDVIHI